MTDVTVGGINVRVLTGRTAAALGRYRDDVEDGQNRTSSPLRGTARLTPRG